MSIYLQKLKNWDSFRVFVKVGTYTFGAGFSVKKYGKEKALMYAKELKQIALDSTKALPTRRRIFDERRKELKCLN